MDDQMDNFQTEGIEENQRADDTACQMKIPFSDLTNNAEQVKAFFNPIKAPIKALKFPEVPTDYLNATKTIEAVKATSNVTDEEFIQWLSHTGLAISLKNLYRNLCLSRSLAENHRNIIATLQETNLELAHKTNVVTDENVQLLKLVQDLTHNKDQAYWERNQLLLLLFKMAIYLGWETGLALHDPDDESWEDDWRTIVYIFTPEGQATWHIHDSEVLSFRQVLHFANLPETTNPDFKWDGHTTDQKYTRLRNIEVYEEGASLNVEISYKPRLRLN